MEEVQSPAFVARGRWVFALLSLEFVVVLASGVGISSLHGASFFSIPADPAFIFFYGIGIPQTLARSQALAFFFDLSILSSLLFFAWNPQKPRLAILLFVLLLIYYLTLVGYLGHRNYQVGFFLVFFPFCFSKERSRYFAFGATRLFIITFYFSAALLKVANGSLNPSNQFSSLLEGQFLPYFVESNTGLRTALNLYLVEHPTVAYGIYLVGFVLELATIVGFFTWRFDKWIAISLLVFHMGNWMVMDIAPWGQLAFISLLFLSNSLMVKRRQAIDTS